MRPEACEAAREALPAQGAAPASDGVLREGAMEGVLSAVGRLGWRAASVRAILEYSGGNRNQFYRHFESKEDCFEQAYALWSERLCVSVLEPAVIASGWRAAVRAGLASLFEFVTARPLTARALLVEVQVAGGAALAKHDEMTERLAGALDSVRGQIEAGEAPPEATGAFVVGGVEAAVCEALSGGDPERVWDALPELMHFAVGSYLGAEAAEAEFEDAKVFLERRRAELGDEVR
jgi:AcrR family transcriptional regulator